MNVSRIAIVLAASAIASCSDETQPETTPIGIGLLTAISGDLAGLGKEFTDATTMAFAEINSSGGVLGRPLRIEVQDDGTSSASAEVGYDELLRLHVPIVLGPTFSAGVEAIAPLIRSGRTLTIGQSTSSPELTKLDDDGFFYRVAASDLAQAQVLKDLVVDPAAGIKEVCVVYRDDAYGTGLTQALKDDVMKSGATIQFDEAAYAADQVDLSKVLDPCGTPADKTPGAFAFVFITFVADGAVILDDAAMRGWKTSQFPFIMTGGMGDPRLLTLVSDPSQLTGARGTGPSGPPADQPEGALLVDFQRRFKERFGRQPIFYADDAYDAAYVAAMAIEIAKTTDDHDAIVHALAAISKGQSANAGDWGSIRSAIDSRGSVNYQGASGNVDFDLSTGDVLPPFWVAKWTIQDGAFLTTDVVKVE